MDFDVCSNYGAHSHPVITQPFPSPSLTHLLAHSLIRDVLHVQHFHHTLLYTTGNWQYSAGVGSDPRDDRYFNIVKQACLYDPDCTFIRLWCPELDALPNAVLHDPRLLTEEMRVELGIDESVLPRPICPLLHGNYAAARPEAGRRKVSKKSLKKMTSHGNIAGVAAFEDL